MRPRTPTLRPLTPTCTPLRSTHPNQGPRSTESGSGRWLQELVTSTAKTDSLPAVVAGRLAAQQDRDSQNIRGVLLRCAG
jgi:hypothetical protein